MTFAADTRLRPDRAFMYAALVIVTGVFATTLAQTQVLARLPLQNLLKNELHVDRTTNAAFFFWAGLAWYLKPLAGILTDAFPLFGSRRKSYILVSATLAGVSWLALTVTPHRQPALRRDRDQRLHGDSEHRGRRLHGRNRAGHIGIRASDRDPPIRPADLFRYQRSGRRLSRQHGLSLDRGGLRRHPISAGAGDDPVPARAATAPGPTRGLDPSQNPTRQHRNRTHDVGSRRAHGAVLHRSRFHDGPFLQAAERTALYNADPGLSRVDLRRLRHPGGGWVRHLVPTTAPAGAGPAGTRIFASNFCATKAAFTVYAILAADVLRSAFRDDVPPAPRQPGDRELRDRDPLTRHRPPDYLSSQTSSRRHALKMLLVFTIAPLTFGRVHVPRSA